MLLVLVTLTLHWEDLACWQIQEQLILSIHLLPTTMSCNIPATFNTPPHTILLSSSFASLIRSLSLLSTTKISPCIMIK